MQSLSARYCGDLAAVLRQGGRAALSFDYYPDEVQAMMEDAGFTRITFSQNKHNLFAAAVKL